MRAIVRLAYEATCAFVPLIAVAAIAHRGGGGNSRGMARHQHMRASREPGVRTSRDTGRTSCKLGATHGVPGRTSRAPLPSSNAPLHSSGETRVSQPSRWQCLAHGAGIVAFAVYVLLVMWICGVGTFWDFTRGGAAGWRSQINLQPFSPYINPVTWLLNVVLFVPLGFLLPCLWRGYDRLAPTLAFGFCFSLAIELSQLLNFRITDVDDLIANTLGAVVGLMLYWLLGRIVSQAFARGPTSSFGVRSAAYEPVLYVAAMFLGVFFLYGARGHAEMRIVSWLDAL